MDTLIIDPEFSGHIPPLADEELQQLEANILADGAVINPIIIWNGIIVDGHNRYNIIQQHPEIPYRTFEKQFPDRLAVLAWICKNQLGRRNLTPEQKKYLIGKQYSAEKRAESFHGNQYTTQESGGYQNDNHQKSEKTYKRIARENGVGAAYIHRAERFANGIDAAEEAEPGIRQEILSGTIKPTAAEVAAVATAPPEQRQELAQNLRKARNQKSEELRQIQEISKNMETSRGVTEESMLDTVAALTETMMSSCDRCFQDFPSLLNTPKFRKRVIAIMQKPKEYILHLENGGNAHAQ